jgi:hypothetical protein
MIACMSCDRRVGLWLVCRSATGTLVVFNQVKIMKHIIVNKYAGLIKDLFFLLSIVPEVTIENILQVSDS